MTIKKFFSIISIMFVAQTAIAVQSGFNGRQIDKTVKAFLALNTQHINKQECAKRRQVALDAIKPLRPGVRAAYEKQINEKNEGIRALVYAQLCSTVGNAAQNEETALLAVMDIINTLINKHTAIVESMAQNQTENVNFTDIIQKAQAVQQALEAIAFIYGTTDVYQEVATVFFNQVKPALISNAYVYITQQLKAAMPVFNKNNTVIKNMQERVTPHAITALQTSGVLAITSLMTTEGYRTHSKVIHAARTQATALYSKLHDTIDQLIGLAQKNSDRKSAYIQAHRACVQTLQAFVTSTALPLNLIYQDTQKRSVKNGALVQQEVSARLQECEKAHIGVAQLEEPKDEPTDVKLVAPKKSFVAKNKKMLIGSAIALALIGIYEMNAEKFGLKPFGIKALLTGQKPDQAREGAENNEPKAEQPNIIKRFIWDIITEIVPGFMGV